jgi:hypothetical protein
MMAVTRGCPKRGVLSSQMYNLVVYVLIGELNASGYYAVAYTDDIVIIINSKFPTVLEVLQTALGLTQQWCDRTDWSINPSKTVVIPFNKKRAFKGLKEQTHSGKTIQVRFQVLTTASMMFRAVFWVVLPCKMIVDRIIPDDGGSTHL